jgi:four helix bundle protein
MQDTGYTMQDAGLKIEKRPQSYKDLEIYLLGKELVVKVHKLTIKNMPKFEMYEEGSQIRRSSKSVVSNIVEGFGRRNYRNDFIRFLTYAIASCDETKAHLEMLQETGSITKNNFEELFQNYEQLGAKLYNFRKSVVKFHRAS